MFSFDKEAKVLSGIKIPPFFHPSVGIGQVIFHYLQRDPTRIVQSCYDDGVELSAGEMAKLASRLAKNLQRENLELGDVIGLAVKNTTYAAPVVLGCMLLGCPISTLDPTFDVSEIENIFKQTNPKLVFCDHDNFSIVTEALKRCENNCEIVTIDDKIEGNLSFFNEKVNS
jgi:4-coumarate--CoA ligase